MSIRGQRATEMISEIAQGVVRSLTRTDMVLLPQSTLFSASTALARPSSRRDGATASSRSRKIESAGPLAAFSKNCCDVAGTASSERWMREGREALLNIT